MNVSLTDELAHYVQGKVAGGRYTSSSEVVLEALRLMEKVEQEEAEKLRFLRKAWQDGIDSGDAEELDFTVLKQEARARLDALKADIDAGLADVAAGRVLDFDTIAIVEPGRKLLASRSPSV